MHDIENDKTLGYFYWLIIKTTTKIILNLLIL